MKDTPKWMTAAGNDIMNCISEGDALDTYPSVDDFAAIIQRHCPDDKVKLMAILRRLDVWARRAPDCEPLADILKDVRAALADYEKTK